jgi:hypothetical protein
MQIEETLPKDNLSVVSFGTGAVRLTQQIDDIRRHGDKYNRTARIPKLAAEVLIEQDMSDVGGSLSIGAATRDDFRLYSYITPIVKGEPKAKISFNGIDLGQEARLVGHYMISIDGIA